MLATLFGKRRAGDRSGTHPAMEFHMHSLYYAPGAASMLVHWLLIELGLPHELKLIDTSNGQHKRPEYWPSTPTASCRRCRSMACRM